MSDDCVVVLHHEFLRRVNAITTPRISVSCQALGRVIAIPILGSAMSVLDLRTIVFSMCVRYCERSVQFGFEVLLTLRTMWQLHSWLTTRQSSQIGELFMS